MNTIRSVGYGWVVLIVAGGGAYFFAKKSINNDRMARAASDRERAATQARLRDQEALQHLRAAGESKPRIAAGSGGVRMAGNGAAAVDEAANPSMEASGHDPAPTRHAPETETQRVAEKSKYEASEVWRSRKGDRFS